MFFRLANVFSLADATIELSTRCLLVSKRHKEETINGVSTTKHEKVKRELVESEKSLEYMLGANTALTNQIKQILDIHSRCDAEKEVLRMKLLL